MCSTLCRRASSTFGTLTIIGALLIAASLWVYAQDAHMSPTPMEQHKHLMQSVGQWEGTLQSFAPGAPSVEMKATEKVTAFGEFFTQSIFNCDFGGVTYTGTGCMGYDPLKKKYVGTWIDTMGPHLAVMEGSMDAENHTITMKWTSPDQESGKPVAHRNVMTFNGKDAYESNFFMGDGEGVKIMTIKMKRKEMATKKDKMDK